MKKWDDSYNTTMIKFMDLLGYLLSSALVIQTYEVEMHFRGNAQEKPSSAEITESLGPRMTP
jgi:hypothetical protein